MRRVRLTWSWPGLGLAWFCGLARSGFVDPADEFGSELLTQAIAHEFEGTDIVQNYPLRASARIFLFSEHLFRVTPRRRRPVHLGGRVRAARRADRAEGRESSWLLRSHEHQVTSNFILI